MSRNRAKARRAVPRRPRHRAPPAPSTQPVAIASGLPLWAAAALGAAIAAVIALRFAEPILDGDLYWHLAYARQMIERGTVVPDHTLYSWTPTNGAYIYCAWLSELLLHGLHRLGDLPALFAFRYLAVGAGAGLLWWFAWRLGLARRLAVYFVILLAVLASHAGTLIKPELVSFLFFHLIVFVYFRAKQADAAAPGTTRLFFWVPAIVLVWVNAHGGFVMAAPFLAATALGEALNRRFVPASALSRTAFRRMLAAWALCGIAILATPYGWRYPAQLVSEYLLSGGARADFVWNAAHLSIFDARAAGLHLVEYGAAMLAVLGVLQWRTLRAGRGIDAAVVLANLAFVPLFAIYLRTSYFWPILFAYSALHVASRTFSDSAAERPAFARAASGALLALFIVFAARSVFEARARPSLASWMGFGPGYINPVAEAEFLARADLGPRLYNIFDSGGYLLWRLHPKYKVMTDSRSFPYLAWFGEQFAFANGEGFADFLRRYPADTAVIDLAKPGAWRNFLAAPEWRLVYYGPTAAIFVKAAGAPDRRVVERARFDDLRNGGTAAHVFDFAATADDHATAWTVLGIIEGRYPGHVQTTWLEKARALRGGHAALARGEFTAARALFDLALRGRLHAARDAAILALLAQLSAPGATPEAGKRAEREATLRVMAVPPP
jgi:hypothetical protein